MWKLYQKEGRQLAMLQRQNAVMTHSAHMQHELAAHGVVADVIPYAIRSRRRLGIQTPRDRPTSFSPAAWTT